MSCENILRKYFTKQTHDLYNRELITVIHNEKSKLKLINKKYQPVKLLCMFQNIRMA